MKQAPQTSWIMLVVEKTTGIPLRVNLIVIAVPGPGFRNIDTAVVAMPQFDLDQIMIASEAASPFCFSLRVLNQTLQNVD